MRTITLIIDTNKVSNVYTVANQFICFVNIDKSNFTGCKEVSFTVREEDAYALELALDAAGLV